MRRVVLATLAVGALTGGAWGQKNYSGSYFCAQEYGGGISYNETTEKWSSTIFNPSERFVLKVDPWPEGDNAHEVTITPMGGQPDICAPLGLPFWEPVQIYSAQVLCTQRNFYFSRFDLETLRYITAYMYGFTDGDRPGNTPSMSGGTCAKIQ